MTSLFTLHLPRSRRSCEFRRKLRGRQTVAALALTLVVNVGASFAQEHDAAQPAGEHAAGGDHGGYAGLLWPVANFLVLAGGLYYFLRAPFTEYFSSRSSQIRKDLVEAADLNRTAAAQLAEVDQKLKALPAELDALKARGAQEIAAEEERIASAAAADRTRLLTQTRREIDVRLQTAQRELSDHAAALAIGLAEQRLKVETTSADHARLVDRYVEQVKGQ